jgi:hypothetical protein
MADVVPLPLGRGARSAPEFGEPAEFFVDLADPARALSLTWSPDQQVVQVSIEAPGDRSSVVILDADDVLNLVRALVEGLPEPGPACPRPPATVLPLTPRPTV